MKKRLTIGSRENGRVTNILFGSSLAGKELE